MTSMMPVLCNSCLHRRSGGATCDAFPTGIPRGIVVYGDDHRTPAPNQGNDIVFELRSTPTAREDFQDWLGLQQPAETSG